VRRRLLTGGLGSVVANAPGADGDAVLVVEGEPLLLDGEDATLKYVFGKSSHNSRSSRSCAAEFSYGRRVELGYARVSTAKQDPERQIEALVAVGIARERIYLDNKSGATVDRRGLRAVLVFARRAM